VTGDMYELTFPPQRRRSLNRRQLVGRLLACCDGSTTAVGCSTAVLAPGGLCDDVAYDSRTGWLGKQTYSPKASLACHVVRLETSARSEHLLRSHLVSTCVVIRVERIDYWLFW
jgi:hypothetical protein